MANDEVIVNLDFSNALNSVKREAVLNETVLKLLEAYRFVTLPTLDPHFSNLAIVWFHPLKAYNKATHWDHYCFV